MKINYSKTFIKHCNHVFKLCKKLFLGDYLDMTFFEGGHLII